MFEISRKCPNVSECIQMHPNASERIQTGVPTVAEHKEENQNSNKPSRKFFAKFSRNFRNFFVIFSSFSKFSDLLGPVRTCSDAFGCIRMHLDAFGCVRMRSDTSRKFRKFLMKKSVFWHFHMFFEEIRKNGRHQQLP